MNINHAEHVDVTAERRLWTAVIATTIEEWVSGPLRLSIEADKYLFDRRSDFEQVCTDAGLDSTTLREKLLAMKKMGMGPSALMMPRTILGPAKAHHSSHTIQAA